MKSIKSLTILIFALVLFANCKKEATKVNDQPNEETVNAEYYLRGDLNGTTLNWQIKDDGIFYNGFGSSSENDKGVKKAIITTAIGKSNLDLSNPKPNITIGFKTLYVPSYEFNSSAFHNFVIIGDWGFGTSETLNIGAKEIIVYYTNEDGVKYNSMGGNQVGNKFSLLNVTKIPQEPYSNIEFLKLKMVFNCTLYPIVGTGLPKTFKNVEACLELQNPFLIN